MTEVINPAGDLESEIAELTRQIDSKKRALEEANGIVHEKEVVSTAVAEHFYGSPLSSSAQGANDDDTDDQGDSKPVAVKPKTATKDYLDTLPPESIESVNSYVAMIPEKGIRQTVQKVQTEQPFLIDAFHDALVSRLYDELKSRGIIKD